MTVMTVNNMVAEIHTPAALVGEHVHALPPYGIRPAYPVDEYPACPENWMHGSSLASSYFVPIQIGRGMWFNFTGNSGRDHDVAVVVSVQGVNPVTGPIKPGEIAELRLEQYKHKCPRHDCDFQQDRYCPKCEYKWPAQNYLATTTGQYLWIDGFRNEKGEVRQYVITEDVAKGVAAQLIGDNRVFAIGFAFYESVNPRPKPQYQPTYGGMYSIVAGDPEVYGDLHGSGWTNMSPPVVHYKGLCAPHYTADSMSSSGGEHGSAAQVSCNSQSTMSPQSVNFVAESPRGGVLRSAKRAPVKTFEIGAGARINQEVGVDTNDISYWKSEPTGMIYVNYTSEEECARILAAGKRQDKKDGAFANLNLAH